MERIWIVAVKKEFSSEWKPLRAFLSEKKADELCDKLMDERDRKKGEETYDLWSVLLDTSRPSISSTPSTLN